MLKSLLNFPPEYDCISTFSNMASNKLPHACVTLQVLAMLVIFTLFVS